MAQRAVTTVNNSRLTHPNFSLSYYRRGQLGSTATSFNTSGFEGFIAAINASGKATAQQIIELTRCIAQFPAGLSARGRAVYSYLCTTFSLETQCDQQLSGDDMLDEEGLRRRTRYLTGDCPLSPISLARVFGLNATRSENSQGLNTTNATLLFEVTVRRVIFGLQGLVGDDGKIDFSKLVLSFSNASSPNIAALLVLQKLAEFGCARNARGELIPVTADSFVRCLAENAVYSCARQEAAQVARAFPDTCTPSMDTGSGSSMDASSGSSMDTGSGSSMDSSS